MIETPREMARRIAAHALCGPEKWKPGVKAGMYEAIMRGDADSEAIVAGPLAAIIETTKKAELAALSAEQRGAERMKEAAARVCEGYAGKPCGPAKLWTPEERSFYDAGQIDATNSSATAIRALSYTPETEA